MDPAQHDQLPDAPRPPRAPIGPRDPDGNPPRPSSDIETIFAYVDAGRPPEEQERLRRLQDLGVDPFTCSPMGRGLLLGREPPTEVLAQLVVRDLRSDGQDADRIRGALGICGVRIERVELEQLIRAADREQARQERPGENFTITGVERVEHADAPSFVLDLERDDQPGERFEVEVRWTDWESLWRFQGRLVREIGFYPALKPQFMGEKFASFAALVINSTSPPAHKPEHGRLHGRVDHTQATSYLLVACLKEHVQASGGTLTCRVAALYEAVTARAKAGGMLPLDWPGTPIALVYAFKRIGSDGFARAGLEWRHYRVNGGDRTTRVTFRLVTEGRPGQAA
jgi:hypothetical protein